MQCKREGFLQKIKEEDGEGCNIHGFLEVNKVAGNFHFAPGKSFHQANVHVHDLLVFEKDSFNVIVILFNISGKMLSIIDGEKRALSDQVIGVFISISTRA